MSMLAVPGRPSPLFRRLVGVSTLVLALAVLTRRADLLPLAGPALWVIAGSGRSGRPGQESRRVALRAVVEPPRCFEGEQVMARLTLCASEPVEELAVRLQPAAVLQSTRGDLWACAQDTSELQMDVPVTPTQWGRWSIGEVRVDLRWARRMRAATVTVRPEVDLVVFPRPAPADAVAGPRTLPYGVGDHASRQPSEGIEFAGIRRYAAGDPARRINWPVSTRRGTLYVTSYAAERPVDVVVMVDAFSDVGPPGSSSLDLAVRGATGLAQAYLRQRDRVGLVVIGGRPRWLTPSIGERQFYRVLDAVMAVRRDRSYLRPALARVPRAALPPSALVVVLSPLLDDRGLEVIRDLRQRGVEVVVIDVLTIGPPDVGAGRMAAAALRLWRLEREAMRYVLADLGIVITPWDGSGPIDLPALRPSGSVRPAVGGAG